jgi:hypothetical protein
LNIHAAGDAILEMYNDAALFKKKSLAIKK